MIVLQAYDQNKRAGYPKKERRIHFSDPFIAKSILQLLKDQGIIDEKFNFAESHLVESCVVANYSRSNKSFYIKAEGEVDLAIIVKNGFLPIEVKWTETLKSNELKQVLKYPNSLILSKQAEGGSFLGVEVRSLVMELARGKSFK